MCLHPDPFSVTEGEQQIPFDGAFLEGSPETNLKPEWVVVSVSIPYTTQVSFLYTCPLALCLQMDGSLYCR